jgi:aspartokinase-like uncharacterized kinase
MNRRKREPSPAAVVKVGGSLFDLPDLGRRLQDWLTAQATRAILLVPGGGPAADVIRQYDRLHGLGEERAHWLALMALALNARLLSGLLPQAVVVPHTRALETLWQQGKIPVLDLYAFAEADEGQPGSLPHSWAVTSDSLAARVARAAGARELILLKSTALPAGMDWAEAGRRGLVDAYFAEMVGNTLSVQCIDFRSLQRSASGEAHASPLADPLLSVE